MESNEETTYIRQLDRFLCHIASKDGHAVWKGRCWNSSPYGKVVTNMNCDHNPFRGNMKIEQWHPT
jgi:hypothetical protein